MPPTPNRRLLLRLPWLALFAAGGAVVVGACGSPSGSNVLGTGTGEDASLADGIGGGGDCAKPGEGCACSTAGQSIACGEVDTNEGSFVTCSEGTRTCSGGKWGACVGTVKVIKSTGSITGSGFHAYGLSMPSSDAGACVSNPCDPTCESFPNDNSNGIDAGPGLTPTDAGGWTLPLTMGDGGTCVGLQCSVPTCGSGQTTTVTGTVLDPAGINPVYNAIVMIPNAGASAVQPIAAGVSNDPCGGAPLPLATTFAYSATNGTFSLTGVPVGASIPLVIQIGRWRRITTINTSSLTCGHTLNITPTGSGGTCQQANNYAANANCPTRLPRVQSEGNIPLTAIATGGLDAIECMLYRMGVSSTMYSDENGSGRIHIFNNGGANLPSPNANHDVSYLLGFPCPAADQPCPATPITTSTSGITNPSFEASSTALTGWTSTGTTSVNSNGTYVYSGSYSALLGSTTAKDIGATTLSQTFTAPAGATRIDFFVKGSCGNSGDYFGASIKDNTAGTTATWGNSCLGNNWVDYSDQTIVAGDSYTITLTNSNTHNNYTYTYVDDFYWTGSFGPTVPSLLNNYDMVMLPCDGGDEYNSVNWGTNGTIYYDDPGRQNLVSYAAAGGRVFTSHWGREWIERTSDALPNGPFPSVANWVSDTEFGVGGAETGVINSGTAWGAPFEAWMEAVGATSGTTFTINPNRVDTSSVTANSELYAYYQPSGSYPADFVFNTPVGSSNPVGRVMYTDMHLANGTPSGTFPSNCPTQGSTLLQQEDAAEYLLFDLGGCVSGQPPPGNPSLYFPATFTRDFQGSCPSGTQVVWQNFYWADTTPGNSSVVFTAWTADTEAQLGTQYPMATLATASGANVCPTGPSCSTMPIGNGTNPGVAVDAALAAAGTPTTNMPPVASHSWLRVNMTLNPTSDQMTAPQLEGWQQTYGCVSSE